MESRLIGGDLQLRTLERICDGSVERFVVADLDDRVQRGREIMAVMREHGCAGSDLDGADGTVEIGADVMVEAPSTEALAEDRQDGVSMGLCELRQDGLAEIELGPERLRSSFIVAQHYGQISSLEEPHARTFERRDRITGVLTALEHGPFVNAP